MQKLMSKRSVLRAERRSKSAGRARLALENLENRVVLSTAALANGTLVVEGDLENNLIQVGLSADGSQVQVAVDGEVQLFTTADVSSLHINGRAGSDYLVNLTGLRATILGGGGADFLQGGSGDDFLDGGNGADIVSDGAGNNTFLGGNGNDSLVSTGGTDRLFGGDGDDTIYDIIGTNDHNGGLGADVLINNGTGTLTSDASDTVVTFRDRGAALTFEDGVINLRANVAGTDTNQAIVTEVGDLLIVTFSDGTTTQTQTFNRADVKFIGFIGGGGSDTFVNNSSVRSVAYGIDGNDTLIGGSAGDILKGGSGDDVVEGRGGRDDLAGNGGVDVIRGGRGANVLRIDALDMIESGTRDIMVGLFQPTWRRR